MSRLGRLIAQDQAHRTYYEREAFKGGACLGFLLGIIAGWIVAGIIAVIIFAGRIA